MLQLERVLPCVSEASKDKNAPQRLAGEDDSQILTETQQEFKMDLPTHHEITNVTENAGNLWKFMWKLRRECGNTEFKGHLLTRVVEGFGLVVIKLWFVRVFCPLLSSPLGSSDVAAPPQCSLGSSFCSCLAAFSASAAHGHRPHGHGAHLRRSLR